MFVLQMERDSPHESTSMAVPRLRRTKSIVVSSQCMAGLTI